MPLRQRQRNVWIQIDFWRRAHLGIKDGPQSARRTHPVIEIVDVGRHFDRHLIIRFELRDEACETRLCQGISLSAGRLIRGEEADDEDSLV